VLGGGVTRFKERSAIAAVLPTAAVFEGNRRREVVVVYAGNTIVAVKG
jgi:hypothetical protein